MNQFQTRLEIQTVIQQWIDQFMNQYQLSAAAMEDALIHAMLNLKNRVIQEYLYSAAYDREQAPIGEENTENGGE